MPIRNNEVVVTFAEAKDALQRLRGTETEKDLVNVLSFMVNILDRIDSRLKKIADGER